MRRPTPGALLTVVLMLVLAMAAAAVALAGPGGRTAPEEASPPAVSTGPTTRETPAAPSGRAPAPSRRPSTPPLPAVTASPCSAHAEAVPLRVLSLNIHGARGPEGLDVPGLVDLLRKADADVALLQEVDRDRPRSGFVDLPRTLAADTGMAVAYAVNVHLGPRRGVSGVATLSRHPIIRRVNTELPHRPGLKQRGLLRTDIDVGGTTVSVYNTHLDHESPAIRRRQAAAVRARLTGARHPVVLGGDLNAPPGSPTLDIIGASLRDAWADAGSGTGATVPARRPRARIDYVMYAQPLRVDSAAVLPDVVSDHRAVRADLVLSVAGDRVCAPRLDGPVGGAGPRGGGAGRDR